jgi:NAD(P)-dependent dehydrogenase (short-subunit alcohol dehydrogenase family)
MRRFSIVLEVARAARFLASSAASYVGQTLTVDGGLLA